MMLTVARALADRSSVGEALSRRRPAREGGAYALIFDDRRGGGRFAGVPIAVKDLIDVAGHRTGCGSRVREDALPAARDATVVARLREAGARLVGKTALVEFAFGATGVNEYEGTPRNPHDRSRIPGGSSSGSAVAVAEGSAAAALGTDTGGSVRIPAALCGVVGVKPSYGLVPVDGVFPLAPSLDHVGVLAPDVASAQVTLGVLATLGERGREPRVAGVDRGALEESMPEVARAIEAALKRWGLELRDVTLPDLAATVATSTTLMYYEAAAVHRVMLASRRDLYGNAVRERLERGLAISEADYRAAQERGRSMYDHIERLFAEVDVIAGPTVGFVAPTLVEAEAPDMSTRLVRHTRLWNVVRFPAISLPVPVSGLPVGIQLAARTEGDAFAAATSLEAALSG